MIPILHRIPIIILTTSKAEEDIIQTYNLGVNSFICKPVSFDKPGRDRQDGWSLLDRDRGPAARMPTLRRLTFWGQRKSFQIQSIKKPRCAPGFFTFCRTTFEALGISGRKLKGGY